MDRRNVAIGQEVLDLDTLGTNKNAMIGLAKLAIDALGSGPLLSGLVCTPGSGLTVSVAAGEIYQALVTDATAYGSMAPDSHVILKQGLLLDPVVLNCPSPGTGGQSINYLVQVTLTEADTGDTVVPFFNSANPTVPYSGPGGSGSTTTTIRADQCVVSVKAGTAAATGSQTTPAPDANNVAAYVVTVANGAVSISTGNIAVAGSAPFLGPRVRDLASLLVTQTDTGAANALAITPLPALQAYVAGWSVFVSPANANTTAATINVSGLGAKAIVNPDGTALAAGEIVAGTIMHLRYDGTSFHFINAPYAANRSANDNSHFTANTAYVDAGDAAAALTNAIWHAATGTNSLAATISPTPAAVDGLSYWIKPANTITGAATLNVTGSAVAIARSDGAALQAGDIVASTPFRAIYDAALSKWRMAVAVASQETGTGIKADGLGGIAPDIDGLANKVTPVSTDEVMIWDSVGLALKKATINNIAAAFAISDFTDSEILFKGMF